MKTITVHTSRDYPVVIGSDLLHSFEKYVGDHTVPCKAVVISDSNVWPLYHQIIFDRLSAAQFHVLPYVLPAGEHSKSGENYLSILNFLAENQVTRSDLLIAFGGGVVGDITGFVAATYLRGIPYIQVPTSLLAMVDSSVGGKTAIDLPAGKNLAGAFYQPHLVLCDLCVLDTLPQDIFQDGCAEVIKYGVLFDEVLFSHLEKQGIHFDREYVISRCVELKRDVVSVDEYDTGLRQKLNLGHTIGHAIEKRSNFSISHGQAVAMGMEIASRAASKFGYCSVETAERIVNLLRQFSLSAATNFTAAQLFHAALTDKKRSGSSVNLIIPNNIGQCSIRPTDISQLENFIEAGL